MALPRVRFNALVHTQTADGRGIVCKRIDYREENPGENPPLALGEAQHATMAAVRWEAHLPALIGNHHSASSCSPLVGPLLPLTILHNTTTSKPSSSSTGTVYIHPQTALAHFPPSWIWTYRTAAANYSLDILLKEGEGNIEDTVGTTTTATTTSNHHHLKLVRKRMHLVVEFTSQASPGSFAISPLFLHNLQLPQSTNNNNNISFLASITTFVYQLDDQDDPDDHYDSGFITDRSPSPPPLITTASLLRLAHIPTPFSTQSISHYDSALDALQRMLLMETNPSRKITGGGGGLLVALGDVIAVKVNQAQGLHQEKEDVAHDEGMFVIEDDIIPYYNDISSSNASTTTTGIVLFKVTRIEYRENNNDMSESPLHILDLSSSSTPAKSTNKYQQEEEECQQRVFLINPHNDTRVENVGVWWPSPSASASSSIELMPRGLINAWLPGKQIIMAIMIIRTRISRIICLYILVLRSIVFTLPRSGPFTTFYDYFCYYYSRSSVTHVDSIGYASDLHFLLCCGW